MVYYISCYPYYQKVQTNDLFETLYDFFTTIQRKSPEKNKLIIGKFTYISEFGYAHFFLENNGYEFVPNDDEENKYLQERHEKNTKVFDTAKLLLTLKERFEEA